MRFDNSPLLSVILPVFNCAPFVGQAIESILDQTFQNFELLIADDGSTDVSRQIIDQYALRDSRIKTFHQTENKGKIETVNRLFEVSVGQYVTVHDADDFSDRVRFEKQIAVLEMDSDLIMCGTSFWMVRMNGSIFKEVTMRQDYREILKHIADASQFHGPTMMMRRWSLGRELYRPFFDGYNEDCDLALRLIEKGRCINLSECLYTYRIRPNSLSKTITPEKKNYYNLAVMFYRQRIAKGKDDLMAGEMTRVNEVRAQFLEQYMLDSSLIYRENAAFLMYYELYKPAINNAWKACVLNPLEFVNWRTLQYCVRKTLVRI